MARIFPQQINVPGFGDNAPTEGEYRLFGALRDFLSPDSAFSCWYEGAIGSATKRLWPDFVIFGPQAGFCVIEVKDWRAGQIRQFTKAEVWLGNRCSKNPERQAKSYGDRLREELRKHRVFPDGGEIPVGRLIAFPFISRDEYRARGFDKVIPEELTLLQDDFDPKSESFVGAEANAFSDRITAVQPFAPPALTREEVGKIEELLWPACVQIPVRAGGDKEGFEREVQYLDAYQARVARTLQRGHQLLKGPPGSGKTLVLVHRCRFLSLFDPEVRRILFVCFNIALASHIRRLLQEQGLSTGKSGVQVHHFFDLCGKVLGEKVSDRYEPLEDAYEYYNGVVERALATVDRGDSGVEPFDAILVDEGQDFDDSRFRLIRALLRPEGDLVVALDTEQDLYHGRRKLQGTWKSLGIDVQGHVTPIRHVYRSTRQLRQFAQLFRRPEGDDSPSESPPEQGLLPFARPTELGEPPELTACRAGEGLLEATVAEVQRSIAEAGYARSEIAVLYDDKQYGAGTTPAGFKYGEGTIGEDLKDALDSAGIPVQWVSENSAAKRYYDITRDSVTLSSVHSAKGLDFDLVILVYPGWPDASRKEWRLRLGPVYVAITRAKHRLVVLYDREDPVIQRMKETEAISLRQPPQG